MKKPNSVSLMLMGVGLLPIALVLENAILQGILLIASIVLNIIAIIKNFQEKKDKH